MEETKLSNSRIISQFIEDVLHVTDISIIINTIHRLTAVCATIGKQDTIEKILTQVPKFMKSLNDEALASLARQLGNIYFLQDGPSGNKDAIVTIIGYLQNLCSEEEIIVRNQALSSFYRIIPTLTSEDILTLIVPVVKSLCSSDWFASRYCGVHIIPPTINTLLGGKPQEKESIESKVSTDGTISTIEQAIKQVYDTPMVRRAAASNLLNYAKQFDKSCQRVDPYVLLRNMAVDDRETVREIVAKQLISIVQLCDQNEFEPSLLPLLDGLIDDCSYNVRKAIATNIGDLYTCLPTQLIEKHIIPLLLRLSSDDIVDVRNAFSQSLKILIQHCYEYLKKQVIQQNQTTSSSSPSTPENQFLNNILHIIDILHKDISPIVRTEIAMLLGTLSILFKRDLCIKYLLPIYILFTKDDAMEVRQETASSFMQLTEILGPQQIITQIVPQILELNQDKSWRVRRRIQLIYPSIAQVIGPKTFERTFLTTISSIFHDHNQTPRETMCEISPKFIQIFGLKWFQDKLLPLALENFNIKFNYTSRITCILFIQNCSEVVSTTILTKTFCPIIIRGLKDDVNNVIISTCKCILHIVRYFDNSFLVDVIHHIKPLQKRADDDVCFFSIKALKAIKEEIADRKITVPNNLL